MIAKDEEIINICVLNNDLYITTVNKIYKCLMVSSTNITRYFIFPKLTPRPREYIDLQSVENLKNFDIAEIIFEEDHRCLYFLLLKSNPNVFKFIKIDLVEPTNILKVDIGHDVHFFEIHNKTPDEFFMISNNVVYHTGFKLLKKNKSFNFFGLGGQDQELGHKGLTEFYRSASFIEFIRFTEDQSKFFVNENKSIKLIRSDNKEILKIYNQHLYPIIDVIFDKTLNHLYR